MIGKCDNCKRDEQEVVHPRVFIAAIKQYASNKNFLLCNDCIEKLQTNVDKGYEQGETKQAE